MSVLSTAFMRERMTRAASDPLRITVTPLLSPHLDAGTLDIRLGRHFVTFRKTRYLGVNVLETIREAERLTDAARRDHLRIEVGRTVERTFVGLGDEFVLHPYQLVLACSLEFLSLPADVGAYVLSRSTTGRLGILSATATFIHPGYRGVPTLELVNTGETAVSITPGMRIAQLVFESAEESKEAQAKGRYQLSTRPEIARLSQDPELRHLARLSSQVTRTPIREA